MKVSVYECGTLVITKLDDIQGMITAINIRFGKIQYEVSYFNNREQRCIWLNENEFYTEAKPKKEIIGFLKSTK